MSEEKMNTEGEMSQNYTNMDTQPKNESQPSQKLSDKDFVVQDFNFFHFAVIFIINLGIVIIAIIEFILRKKSSYLTTIFDYLVDIFILFVFLFVICFFFTKKENYLKGLVYYPICTFYWSISDLLTIFCFESSNNWNIADTLKVSKASLIIISLLINISYIKICKK